jgi:hypothetical protein
MRTIHLVATFAGTLALALLATDASAMYNPSTGTWLQRDPGPGGMMPATPRVTGGPVISDGFLPRDPVAQYRDGMNLYEYVRSQPLQGIDPLGLFLPRDPVRMPVGADEFGQYTPRNSIEQVTHEYQMNAVLHPGGPPTVVGAEFGAFVLVGASRVSCCDEKNNYRKMTFDKYGWGGVIGASGGVGVIHGMDGAKCKHETYEGYFLEFGVTAGVVGGFVDFGLSGPWYDPWNISGGPTFSGVVEGGPAIGVGAEAKLFVFAWYNFLSEEVLTPNEVDNPCVCKKIPVGTP